MHERDELPEIDVPAIERELIEIAIRVSRERHSIPAAGTIVDGTIQSRKLHKRLDHGKRRLGIQARDLFWPENLVGRGHPRVRAAADRRIEVSQVHASGQVTSPHGWRDTHERILQREVRSGILAAVRPDSVEILLRKVAPSRVHLQVGSVSPCVEIFALRARKPERSLGDEIALQGCTCRRPEIEGHAKVLVSRASAKPSALADPTHPGVDPARRVEDSLEDQVFVNLVKHGFQPRAPFRGELVRLGLAFGAILVRTCRLGSGRLRAQGDREEQQQQAHGSRSHGYTYCTHCTRSARECLCSPANHRKL